MMQRNLLVHFSMITFDQVTKRYPGGFEALSQVNFSLQKGEMAFLTGHSGAGKSTLLKLIALLEWPTSGQLTVNGLRLNHLKNAMLLPIAASWELPFNPLTCSMTVQYLITLLSLCKFRGCPTP